MASFLKKIKGVFRVFNAIKGFISAIKSAVSLLSLPLVGWALVVVAVIAIYMVATNYEELRSAIVHMRQDFISRNAPAGAKPEIETSVTKDDPQWMFKYCSEQAGKLPIPPFKYQKSEKKDAVVFSIPSVEVNKRLPQRVDGYKVDSLTCRIIYDFDDKEAFTSMGVEYRFDIKAFNEFKKRVDEMHTLSMDQTWEKIFSVDQKTSNPSYAYQGFPMLFMRENPKLGTVEYAEMDFAIDYWVKFTVYENQNKK